MYVDGVLVGLGGAFGSPEAKKMTCTCKKPDYNRFGNDNLCAKCGEVIAESKLLSLLSSKCGYMCKRDVYGEIVEGS